MISSIKISFDAPMDLIRIDLALKFLVIKVTLNVVMSGTTGTFYVNIPVAGKPICAL